MGKKETRSGSCVKRRKRVYQKTELNIFYNSEAVSIV